MPETIYAIIAGGASSRFGSDKKLAAYRGQYLLERMLGKGLELGWPIMIAVRAAQQGVEIGNAVWFPTGSRIRFVIDPPEIEGPIAGLAAVLRAVDDSHVFATSVDLPLLDPLWIGRLAAAAVVSPGVDVLVPRTDRGLEPLAAIYSSRCRNALEVFTAGGGRSLERFILSLPGERVRPCEVAAREAAQFANVNTPEDLANLASAAAGTSASSREGGASHAS